MVCSFLLSYIINVASSWKVIFEFMKGACHDSIGKVKGLFHSIAMMNIDIDVQHSLVHFKKF